MTPLISWYVLKNSDAVFHTPHHMTQVFSDSIYGAHLALWLELSSFCMRMVHLKITQDMILIMCSVSLKCNSGVYHHSNFGDLVDVRYLSCRLWLCTLLAGQSKGYDSTLDPFTDRYSLYFTGSF